MATNEEKFRTPEERVKAFREFLHKRCGRGICERCEVRASCEGLGYDGKFAGWLTLEAEAEKPDPCYECGGKMVGDKGVWKGHYIYYLRCTNCGHSTGSHIDFQAATITHNRIARAVRADKESEAGK